MKKRAFPWIVLLIVSFTQVSCGSQLTPYAVLTPTETWPPSPVATLTATPSPIPSPTFTPTPYPTPAPLAEAYIDEVLGYLQENFYYADDIDWERWRANVMRWAAGAQTSEDTYPAISRALRTLNDRHTSFIRPDQMAAAIQPSVTPPIDFVQPRGSLVADRIAHIILPSLTQDREDETGLFVTAVQERIRTLDAGNPCGWVLDLRGNTGGSTPAMLAGIGPILGDGGGMNFVDREGTVTAGYIYQNGRAMYGDLNTASVNGPAYRLQRENPPVAILIDDETASAAESILVAFLARPNTRTFGQPTWGLTTSPGYFQLSDGAWLRFPVVAYADLNGNIYDASIQPDETIAMVVGMEIPPVVIDWLLDQPACTGEQSFQNQAPSIVHLWASRSAWACGTLRISRQGETGPAGIQ